MRPTKRQRESIRRQHEIAARQRRLNELRKTKTKFIPANVLKRLQDMALPPDPQVWNEKLKELLGT